MQGTKTKINKKQIKSLDITLILVGVSTLVFTIVMLVYFAIFQCIPDVLCERFFTCVVGECGITGLIQVVKTLCKYKYSNLNTNEILNEEEFEKCLDENLDENEETEINNEGVDCCG